VCSVCCRGGHKFFLAGEMDKALPMSPRRVRSIAVSEMDTTVELVGSPGELVQFDVCNVYEPGLHYSSRGWIDNVVTCNTVSCKITGSGVTVLSKMHAACS